MKVEIRFANPLTVVHQGAPDQQWRARFRFEQGTTVVEGENMEGTMQAGSYATTSVEWKDAGGNTVKVDGPTKWESTDTTVVQCTVSAGNPQIANLFAPGKVGKASIHATADADLGEGVRAVTAPIDITVISGEAVGGEITFTPGGTGPTAQSKAGAGLKR